jgi:hypothetical protein
MLIFYLLAVCLHFNLPWYSIRITLQDLAALDIAQKAQLLDFKKLKEIDAAKATKGKKDVGSYVRAFV